MPDADAIRATIEQYLTRFSAGDREGWLDLWADGATMEDPVGSPIRKGREQIGAFYDQGQANTDKVELLAAGAPIVVGGEAAFPFEVRPTLGGVTMSMPAIDVMTFDEDARITSQRAFVDFGLIRPVDAE
jgi:steroid delta-isomerase